MEGIDLISNSLIGKWDCAYDIIDIKPGKIIDDTTVSGKVHTTIENSDCPSGIYDYTIKSINNKCKFHFNGLVYLFDVNSLENRDSLILIEAETNHALILVRISN